jgi:Fic family protein
MFVASPPDYGTLLTEIDPGRLVELIRAEVPTDGRAYLHWDKLRHLDPPDQISHHEWWFLIKWSRRSLIRTLPLEDACGLPFGYSVPDVVLRRIHFVDQRCSGEIPMSELAAEGQARQHYLVSSLMEEAIRSSQLEGATTSRKAAKEMLRSGRPPADRSERMILNNYTALQFMREGIGPKLTPSSILSLHRILTEETLDNPDAAGRLQTPDDERIAVLDRQDGSLMHTPPPAEQLPERIQALCAFANAADDPEHFVHPVLRGIILHFWLAYDHPFEDGNGRTARALFYWYLRERGYWLTEYLSISKILRDAPSQYSRAFLLTETDERDTTYFIVYQLAVIERAVEELHTYLARKVQEVRDVEKLMTRSSELNHRQLALLSNAIRTPEQSYSFRAHAVSHGVTHETARSDLLPLAEKGLLEQRKVGRRYVFSPAPALADRIRTLE